MNRTSLLAALPCLALLAACPAPPPPGDGGVADDAGAEPADGGSDDAGVEEEPEEIEETEELEPNDISDGDEANPLPLGARMRGSIAEPGDADAFEVLTTGGRAYRVHLRLPAGSALQGHLTVFDNGRDGSPASADYVQLSQTGVEADVNLELLASGDGHYVIVRDLRAVGGGDGSGGDDHTYELWVEELEPQSIARPALSFPDTVSGTLPHAGAIHLYPFEAVLYDDVILDLEASADMDGRLVVISDITGEWIARNDDRGGSVDPLIDAPMTAGGDLWLVVDNVAPDATSLGYTMTTEKP